MGAAEMSIRVGADVQGAVSGLNQVAASTAKTTAALGKLPNVSNQATQSLNNLSRVAQDAPYGFIGIANNLNPLLESFQRLKATTGSTGSALKALGSSLMGAGGVGLALGVVSSLAVVFGDKLFGAGKKAKETAEELKRVSDLLKDVSGNFAEKSAVAAAGVDNEIAKVTILSTVISDQTKSYKERNNALNELKSINKNYFGDLTLETNSLATLTARVEEYTNALISAAVVKEFSADIAKIAVESSKQLNTYNKLGNALDNQVKKLQALGEESKTATDDTRKLELELQKIATQKRIDDATKALSKQGLVVGQLSTSYGTLRQGLQEAVNESLKFKPLNTPGVTPVKIKADKIDISDITDASVEQVAEQIKDGILGARAFNFIKIPIKKIGYTLESPGSAAGNADSSDDFIERQIQNMNALGDTITGFVTPAFDAMFATIAKGGNVFKAFGQAIIQSLVQVISKLITTVALAAILSAATGGAAGIGFKGMSGFKNIFSGLMGFRAGGGPVSSGMPYMVGENGPEMFYPETSGRIQPAGMGRISQGQIALQVTGRLEGSGNALVAVIEGVKRSQNRLS